MIRTTNKISTFRSGQIQRKPTQTYKKTKSEPLHPIVRRRRFFWLCFMVVFIGWFLFQLVVQQVRIWDQEEKLAVKQEELQVVQVETKQLKKQMKKLQSPDYLLELAHQLGYTKKNEQNYHIPKE